MDGARKRVKTETMQFWRVVVFAGFKFRSFVDVVTAFSPVCNETTIASTVLIALRLPAS